MTYLDARRHIAHHEAAQLRAVPVRHWRHVTSETKAMLLLFLNYGHIPRCVPLVPDMRGH